MQMKSLVLFALLMLATTAGRTQPPNADYKKKGSPIPPFVIEQPDGRLINHTLLQKGKPAVIAIFSPQCDHCAAMLDTLRAMAPLFRNRQLVLVTEARNKDFMKDFLSKHGYDKEPLYRNIGWDKGNLIYFLYTYALLPQFNVYDANHKLVKTFTGAFPLDSLRMVLR